MRTLMLLTAIILSGCGSHYGAIKPNAGLADFDKYGKAYYLSVDQIPIGSTQSQVINEYGTEYEVLSATDQGGHKRETWKFISYRARLGPDPVDKHLFISFEDGLVTRVWEERPDGSPTSRVGDAINEIEKLKRLLDENAITPGEYEKMKAEIMRRMQ